MPNKNKEVNIIGKCCRCGIDIKEILTDSKILKGFKSVSLEPDYIQWIDPKGKVCINCLTDEEKSEVEL